MADLTLESTEEIIQLVSVSGASQGDITSAVATHNADTTAVHGIADTSALDTVTARNAAIAAHDDLATAHDLTANISAALSGAASPSAANVFATMAAITAIYNALGISALPYSIDFTAEPDGYLPSEWSGASWQISSGQAVNTPTLDAELLGDPGLEGTYAGGLNSWMLNSGGTPTESADAHGGSKAQQYVGAAVNNNLRTYQTTAVANRWYYATQWLKRSSGTSGTARGFLNQAGGYNDTIGQVPVTYAAYTQQKLSLYSSGGTGNIFLYADLESGSSDFDTIIVDDVSLKLATTSTLFASILSVESDVILRSEIVPDGPLFVGLVLRLDNESDPQNYILAHIRRHGTYTWPYAGIMKFVNGTMTEVLAPTYIDADLTAGALFEVRASGSTVGIYYNNVQIDTDKTINDATLLTNKRHGIFSTGGGCAVKSFFALAN